MCSVLCALFLSSKYKLKEVDENLLPSNNNQNKSKSSSGSKSKSSKLIIPPRGSFLTLLSRPSVFANEDGALAIGEFEPISSIIPKGQQQQQPPTHPLLSKAKVLGTLNLNKRCLLSACLFVQTAFLPLITLHYSIRLL